ncbi:Uncharacterised protein [Enterobacter kobei]|nr:Uncharacterised protein [Enterobacter kobei]
MKLANYCHLMGLFIEQVKEWLAILILAHEINLTENRLSDKELCEDYEGLKNNFNVMIEYW